MNFTHTSVPRHADLFSASIARFAECRLWINTLPKLAYDNC